MPPSWRSGSLKWSGSWQMAVLHKTAAAGTCSRKGWVHWRAGLRCASMPSGSSSNRSRHASSSSSPSCVSWAQLCLGRRQCAAMRSGCSPLPWRPRSRSRRGTMARTLASRTAAAGHQRVVMQCGFGPRAFRATWRLGTATVASTPASRHRRAAMRSGFSHRALQAAQRLGLATASWTPASRSRCAALRSGRGPLPGRPGTARPLRRPKAARRAGRAADRGGIRRAPLCRRQATAAPPRP